MLLSEKKGFILKYVRLGMDIPSSMICAECTDEEMELLDADTEFQRIIKFTGKYEESRMLEDFERARKANISLNDTRDTRWLLEKIDPERFGTGKKSGVGKNGMNIHIDFGDASEIGDDNTEEFNGEAEEL